MVDYVKGGAFRRKEAPPTESILGKSLPTNLEAERAVLSAVLLDDQNLSPVSELLRPADFYNKRHQIIFQAIVNLAQANKKLDLLVLQDALQTSKQLEEVGGIVER